MINRKVVIVVRGVSNSGKSSFAEYLRFLCDISVSCVICTADDFFTDSEGKYNFDPTKLGVAHNKCQQKFVRALEDEIELIIVANTNAEEKHLNFYTKIAQEFGYQLFSIVVEKRFEGGNNNHNVPESNLIKQENNIKHSLKLR